ncbi:DUF6289 family protein [Nonomuraea sp. H19]|uniref:DUF6289 family protein n=1 Tax=Nonomuraea sp. H19 TaxID=3452206 RepID=UPI003F8A884E
MIRRALLATLLAAATVTTVTAGPAQARACPLDYHCVTTYYADSTYTSVVGQKVAGCAGDEYTWGRRTYHPEYVETPC